MRCVPRQRPVRSPLAPMVVILGAGMTLNPSTTIAATSLISVFLLTFAPHTQIDAPAFACKVYLARTSSLGVPVYARGASTRIPGIADRDRDFVRHHRRVMRHVLRVPKDELKRVLARCQLQLYFGLSAAEMQVIGIARDRHIEGRGVGIDDEVVMPGIGLDRPRALCPYCAGRSGSWNWDRSDRRHGDR